MSVEADPRPPMTTVHLVDAIDRYVSERRSARDVEERWLASYLDEPLRIARQVRNRSLDHDFRNRINEFRCAEIVKEKEARQREIDILDREARNLTKADSSPPPNGSAPR